MLALLLSSHGASALFLVSISVSCLDGLNSIDVSSSSLILSSVISALLLSPSREGAVLFWGGLVITFFSIYVPLFFHSNICLFAETLDQHFGYYIKRLNPISCFVL